MAAPTPEPSGSPNATESDTPSRFGNSFWLTKDILLGLAISILLLIPCFWHSHIQAGDLGSHTYNAWLAQLTEQGRAPGIYLAWQWDNILFDLLLFHFSKFVGFTLAEKLSVSVCVLAFFWGVFAFIDAATRRPPW